EWSSSSTPMGSCCASPAEKIHHNSATASSGTQLTIARSHGRWRSRRASRRALWTIEFIASSAYCISARGAFDRISLHQHRHAGPCPCNGLQRARAHFKGAHVKALAGARGPPGGEVGQGGHVTDLEACALPAQRRQAGVKFAAH